LKLKLPQPKEKPKVVPGFTMFCVHGGGSGGGGSSGDGSSADGSSGGGGGGGGSGGVGGERAFILGRGNTGGIALWRRVPSTDV
jgi:hypothetical protein